MAQILRRRLLDYLLGSVWFAMGLYCKVLGLITRHELIVGEILGKEIAPFFTPLIGVGEVLLGLWIVTGYQRKLTSVIQIVLVLLMNILELLFASQHLLWGPFNFLFASMFCVLVYFNGFHLHNKKCLND